MNAHVQVMLLKWTSYINQDIDMVIFDPYFLERIVIINFKQIIFKSEWSEKGIFLIISF